MRLVRVLLVVAALAVAGRPVRAASRWLKLLEDATYAGTSDKKWQPLVTGVTVTKIKAVYRSGYVSCNNAYNPSNSNFMWQTCNPSHGTQVYSFELKKNNAYVLQQSNWHTLPSGCAKPSTPTGDIVCAPGGFTMNINAGDTLTPTWYEASRQTSLGDNGGTIHIDLYGWVDVGDQSLVWWKADEGTGTTLADTGLSPAQAGTLKGGASWEQGRLRFSAAGDQVESPQLATGEFPSGDAPVSMSVWVYWDGAAWPDTFSDKQSPLALTAAGANGAAAGHLAITLNAGRPTVDFFTSELRADDPLKVRTWHHLAVTKAPGAKLSKTVLYVNGAPVVLRLVNSGGVGSPDAAPSFSARHLVMSPGSLYKVKGWASHWVGYLDHVRYSTDTWAANTVKAVYQSSLPEHSRNYVLKFDGDKEHITMPPAAFGGSAITLEAWVYARDPYASGQGVISLSDGSQKTTIELGLQSSTGLAQYFVDNRPATSPTPTNAVLASSTPFPRYRWTHLAAVQSGGTVSMYWDGRLMATTAAMPVGASRTRLRRYIGRSSLPATKFFYGSLDDVRMWTVARSQTQIVTGMRNGGVARPKVGSEAGSMGLFLWYGSDPSDSSAFTHDPVVAEAAVDWAKRDNDGTLVCENGCIVPGRREGAICGDGFRQGDEECDDGNNANGDGCKNDCTTESGYVCLEDSGFSASHCVTGGLEASEPFDDSAVALGRWTFVTGERGARAVAQAYAYRGTGGARLYCDQDGSVTSANNPITYMERGMGSLGAGSVVRFAFNIQKQAHTTASPLIVVFMDGSASRAPVDCLSSACTDVTFFKVCYNSAYTAQCDQRIDGVAPLTWQEHAFMPFDKLREKYGAAKAMPSTLKVQFAVYGQNAKVETWVDEVRHVKLTGADAATCPELTASSVGGVARSCYEHYLRGSRSNGVYKLDRGAGPFDLYCNMGTAGGGWDLVSVRRSARLDFGGSRCTSLGATCSGNINTGSGVDYTLVRSDAETLTTCIDNANLWGTLTGFSTSTSGIGLLATYMTRKRRIHPSQSSCSYRSGTYYHYCGQRAESALKWTGTSGWSKHSTGPSLYTWIRGGGIWIGDTTGGGSGSNHQLDMSYFQNGMAFQRSPYKYCTNYALWYRSKTWVGSNSGSASSITRGGVNHSPNQVGLNMVVIKESTASGVEAAQAFKLGDGTQESALVTFLNGVADGNVVVGALTNSDKAPVSPGSLSTALNSIGVRLPNLEAGSQWVFVGRKGFPLSGLTYSVARPGQDAGALTMRNLFACYGQTLRVAENTPSGSGSPLPVRVSGTARPTGYQIVRSEPAPSDSVNDFAADPVSGQVRVPSGYLDAEKNAGKVTLRMTARKRLYDSGWFRLSSQAGANSYRQLTHNLDVDPAYVRTRVQIRAIDGANQGYVFNGMGSAQQSDSRRYTTYGGVVFAYNGDRVRLWAPSKNNGYANGRIINVGNGWGGQKYLQSSQTAEVRVDMIQDSNPDYDSGWFPMNANAGSASYKQITHGFGSYPERVKVMVRAVDGNNNGYVFEGIRMAQGDDDYGEYGGLVYCYDKTRVRLFAPDRSNNQNGYIIYVNDGWAGTTQAQQSTTGLVRVLAWKEGDGEPAPTYESEWFEMISDRAQAFFELSHGLGRLATRVQIQIKALAGNNKDFYYEGEQMAQENSYDTWTSFGGVCYAYSEDTIRLWAPTRDPRNANKASYGVVIFHADGWGGEVNAMNQKNGMVRVRMWTEDTDIVTDAATVTMNVMDVREPPIASDHGFSVPEDAAVGRSVGKIAVTDEDVADTPVLSIAGGDPKGVFRFSAGDATMLEVAKANMLDYDQTPVVNLVVRASDGLLHDYASVVVKVIDVNSRPTLKGATFTVYESSPVNEQVGTEPEAHDSDEADTLLFSILSGNKGGAFKIAQCGGQIRVAKNILDFEGDNQYTLLIAVTDDGEPSLSANATFTINVLNRNDPPQCVDKSVTLPENSAVGTAVDTLTAVDPDGDVLTWFIDFGNDENAFNLAANGDLTVARYVIDYERRNQYVLGVVVTDSGDGNLTCASRLTINVLNRNDPPVVPANQTLALLENNEGPVVVGKLKWSDEDVGDTVKFAADPVDNPASPSFIIDENGTISVAPGVTLDFEARASYLLNAIATDSASVPGSTPMSTRTQQLIEVLDGNDPPEFTSTTAFDVDENSPKGTVLRPGPLTAADEDALDGSGAGAGLKYSLSVWGTWPEGGQPFDVNPDTGDVFVTGKAPLDYEKLDTYKANATVTDGSFPPATDTVVITITLKDVNDAPVLTCGEHPVTWFDSPGSAVSTVDLTTLQPGGSYSDPAEPTNDIFNYDLNATAATPTLERCRAACLADARCWSFTFFTPTFYTKAYQGQCYGLATASPTMVPRGGPTELVSSRKAKVCRNFTVAENTAVSTVLTPSGQLLVATDEDVPADVVQISIADGNPGDAFAITANIPAKTGELKVAGPINYETNPVFRLIVRSEDFSSRGPKSSTAVVLVSVTNVDEPPDMPAQSFTVKQGAADDVKIGAPINARDPEKGTSVVFHAITDGSVNAGSNPVNADSIKTIFTIDAASGQLRVKSASALAPYTNGRVFSVTVQACDGGAVGVGLCRLTVFTISVIDGNRAPTVADNQVLTIKENSGVNAALTGQIDVGGQPYPGIVATDEDGDPLTYVLKEWDTPGALDWFWIGETNGKLYVKKEGLDFETTSTYNLLVEVTDFNVKGNRSTTAIFTVNVQNVEELPSCPKTEAGQAPVEVALRIKENSPVGTVVGQVTCYDDDLASPGVRQSLNYSIIAGGDTPPTFKAVSLTPASLQKYRIEVAADAVNFERRRNYTLTLQVDDNHGGKTTSSVFVEVEDVEEAPVFDSGLKTNISVPENVAIGTVLATLSATDPDGDFLFYSGTEDFNQIAMLNRGPNLTITEPLDYEAQQAYDIGITVTDRLNSEFALEAQLTVHVSVEDVNDVAVTDISPATFGTEGGETVVLTGSNFGWVNPPAGHTVVVTATYGPANDIGRYTAKDCVVAVANTAINCTTVAGVGADLYWSVTVDGQSASTFAPHDSSTPQVSTAYAAPVITGIASNASPTRGGQSVVITGTNFGPFTAANKVGALYSRTMLYDASATCSVDEKKPHTTINCTTVAGAGRDHEWYVVVGGQKSAWSAQLTTSYAAPQVWNATGAVVMSTRGGQIVRLIGDNFGPGEIAGGVGSVGAVVPYHVVSASYGDGGDLDFAASKCTVVVAHTQVECVTAPGVGAMLAWRASVGDQPGDPSDWAKTSYRRPVVTKVSGEGALQATTLGNSPVLLDGTDFGPAFNDPSGLLLVRGGYGNDKRSYIAQGCEVLVAHTRILCKTAAGTGFNYGWHVTIGGVDSERYFQVFARGENGTGYAAPIVSSFSTPKVGGLPTPRTPQLFRTQGSETVLIQGSHFGALSSEIESVAYTRGEGGAVFKVPPSNCTITVPHETIACRTVPGAGKGLEWLLYISGQESTNPVTAYAPPEVTALLGNTAAALTDGGETMWLVGSNFGPAGGQGPFVDRVSYGPQGTEFDVAAFKVFNHTHIRVTTRPGSGAGLGFVVVVDGQPSSLSNVKFAYAPPKITGIAPATASTQGGTIVTLTGSDFAVLDPNAGIYVMFGNAADRTVRGPIAIDRRIPDPRAALPSGYVRGSPHKVTFAVPAGLGALRNVVVQVHSGGSVVSSPPTTFSFRDPELDFVEVTPWPDIATAAQLEEKVLALPSDEAALRFVFGLGLKAPRRLKIAGRNFGPPGLVDGVDVAADSVVRQVLVQERERKTLAPKGDFTPNNVTVFSWNHTEIIAFSSLPVGGLKVRTTGKDGAGSDVPRESGDATFVDYSPEISNLVGGTRVFDTKGGELMTIEVKHMLSATSVNITVDGKDCPMTNLAGDPIAFADIRQVLILNPVTHGGVIQVQANTTWKLPCRMPAGQGKDVNVVVYRDNVRSGDYRISYHAPSLTTIAVDYGDGKGFDPRDQLATLGPWFGPTTGGRMRMRGANLGTCPTVRIARTCAYCDGGMIYFCDDASKGITATPGATRNADHTELIFPLPSGEGAGPAGFGGVRWLLEMEAGLQRPFGDLYFSYLAPTVDTVAVTKSSWTGRALQSATVLSPRGGEEITITGTNFGVFQASDASTFPRVWVGSESLGYLPCSPIVQDSQERLRCRSPGGTGTGLRVRVNVAGQTVSTPPPGTAGALDVRYASPTITALSKATGPAAGGYNVTLTGTNLGARNASHCVFVSWAYAPQLATSTARIENPRVCDGKETWPGEGEIPFERISVHKDGAITFLMPAGAGDKMVTVDIRGQQPAASTELAFRYDAPVLNEIFPPEASTDGGTEVLLRGSNFGYEALAPQQRLQVLFHRSVCNLEDPLNPCKDCKCHVVSYSDDEIKMTVPGGIGTDRPVIVKVLDGSAAGHPSLPLNFSYSPPEIKWISPGRTDARGESIEIHGINFGRTTDLVEGLATAEERLVKVEVHGDECKDPKRALFGVDEPILACNMQEATVGNKNVTIWVAGQRGHIPHWRGMLYTRCSKGYYGNFTERCLECAQGSVCDGQLAEPRSEPGWYILDGTVATGTCRQGREHRSPKCNHVVPCEPKWACTGNNTCTAGYRSIPPYYRCSECDNCYRGPNGDGPCKAYYRVRGGECEECPSNPLLLVIMFATAAICLALAGYVLNRKNMHLAFLSIGVDYFQILAMFANSRVSWPPLIKDIFQLMSVFNLNLELIAPECSFPDIQFEGKWLFVEVLPLCAVSLFLFAHMVLYCKKKLVLRRKKKLHTHVSVLIATTLILFYYLYLYLTRTTLDVFNCGPTDPPEPSGQTYLQAVFVPCGVPGGLQMRLLPIAIVTLIVYSIGYPIVVGTILWKNRFRIMEDQLLRAMGKGNTRLENRHAYEIRKRYHKVYYHFKPKYFYWILCILLRKFMIAFTALMFNRNPAFQLSIALLIMFASYAAQVRHVPYMSPSERERVLDDHQRAALDGDELQQRLMSELAAALGKGRKTARKADMNAQKKAADARKAVSAFFFNYNSVEAILLACAVLVNLAGVMFESNRFQSEYYQQQKEVVTIVVLLIIFLSVAYFFGVLFMEIYATCVPDGKRFRFGDQADKAKGKGMDKKKTAAMQQLARATRGGSASGLGMEMGSLGGGSGDTGAVNPMFIAAEEAARAAGEGEGGDVDELITRSAPPDRVQWAAVRNGVAELKGRLASVTAELAEAKKKAQMAQAGSSTRRMFGGAGRGGRGGRGGAKDGRKQFGQVKAPRSSRVMGQGTPPEE